MGGCDGAGEVEAGGCGLGNQEASDEGKLGEFVVHGVEGRVGDFY